MTVTHDTSGHTIGANSSVIADGAPGLPGAPGADAAQYVIGTPDGTALYNGTGQVTVQLQLVQGSGITNINSGNVQLWNTPDNSGIIVGNGYTAVLGPPDINGSLTVYARDIGSSVVYDTTTIVDIYDGADGDPGTPGEDAVYGYILPSNGLVWIRDSNNVWTPGTFSTVLTAYFVRGGATIATRAAVVTMNPTTGTFTASEGGSSGEGTSWGVPDASSGTQRITLRFTHNATGVGVIEQVVSVRDGLDGQDGEPGEPGQPGAPGSATLSIKPNYISFDTPNNGELYIHGYDVDGNPADVAGSVPYASQQINVAAGSIYAGSIGRGHIILESNPVGFTFAHGGTQTKVALCYRNDQGNWFYDANGAMTAFTPTQTMLSIGLWTCNTPDVIDQASITPAIPFDATTGNLGWSDIVTSTMISDGSITTPKLAAGSVQANNISVANLAAIATATGALTSGTITIGTSGYIRQGKSSYADTGAGFWIGDTAGTPQINIGNASNYLRWTGAILQVAGAISITSGSSGYDNLLDAPGSLQDLDPTQDTKLDGIQTGATNNGTDINSSGDIVGQVNISSQGIVLTGTTSFIKSSGKDSLGDSTPGIYIGRSATTGGAWDVDIGNSQKYIRWDGSAGSLEIGGDLIVTENIVNNAITVPYIIGASTFDVTAILPTWQTVLSTATLPTGGGSVLLQFTGMRNTGSNAAQFMTFRFMRDSTPIWTQATAYNFNNPANDRLFVGATFMDQLATGNHVYSLQAAVSISGTAYLTDINLVTTVLKR